MGRGGSGLMTGRGGNEREVGGWRWVGVDRKDGRRTGNGTNIDARLINQNAHRGPINGVPAHRGPMRVFSTKRSTPPRLLDRRVLSIKY